MRQPTTPAALQPKPMHMVSACLPQVCFLEAVVQIEGNARKVSKIFQQSEQREEDCHRGSMTGNDPRQHPPNAQHQTVVQPFWRVQQAEQVAQSLLYPKQRICQ